MFSAFFGHYLLNQKIITSKQLQDAMAVQDQIRLKLGTMAINAKMMTVTQVEDVHMQQLTCDKRFGELAVESDYITEKQLSKLLKSQKSEHLLLAQALVDMDLLTFDQYEEHLNNYKEAHQMSEETLESLKKDDVDAIVTTFLTLEDEEHSSFYMDYVRLFLKSQVRFINSNVRLGKSTAIKKTSYDHLIRQNIHNNHTYFTALAGEEHSMIAFAGMYADEKFKVFGEYPIDAIGEYMNQNNGLFIVNKNDEGQKLTMDIQTHIEAPTLKPYRNVYDIPLHCVCGDVHLILGLL